jgi:hypothetical protein
MNSDLIITLLLLAACGACAVSVVVAASMVLG